MGTDVSHSLHELSSELLVHDQFLLVVADAELLLLVHRVGIEETSSGEAWQVLAVRVTSEDEAARGQAQRLVGVVVHLRALGLLIVGETDGLARHVARDQSFTETQAGFNVDLLLAAVCGVGRVDYVSVFRGNDPLNENGHEDLVKAYSELFGCEIRPFVELTGPDSLDRVPGLVELPRWDTELKKLLFQEFVVRILRVEFQAENEVLAFAEVFVHFGACGFRNLVDERIELVLSRWLKAHGVLLQLKWETCALRHFDRLLELVSYLPEVV